ncbi:hypothetical protein BDV18DRAFT_55914 [Aspergillus unguis]
MKELSFLIIGAGSRGSAYARAITTSTPARISSVAEPDPYKRRALGEKYIWGNDGPKHGQEFNGWEEWIEYETNRRKRQPVTNGASKGEGEEEEEEGVDGVLICVLDETHILVLDALAKANLLDLHVLCEKPLALSLDDCLSVYAAWTKPVAHPDPKKEGQSHLQPKSIFSIGHVLRYSPHNLTLRRLVREEKVIGDIVSIEHTEPVGHWHFAHSYVRGNWRRETEKGDGSLLTKSCHDVDFLMWLVEGDVIPSSFSPFSGESDGVPNGQGSNIQGDKKPSLRSIHSTGHLTQFTPSQKPPAAGSATNCVSCPIEKDCTYSAIRIYRDNQLRKGETRWPVNIVCPDIEDYLAPEQSSKEGGIRAKHGGIITPATESRLLSALTEDYSEDTDDATISKRPWYGRCVWESDNDVVDDQIVTLAWDIEPSSSSKKKKKNSSGITAVLHMTAPTESQCVRRGRIYGTEGEITYTSSTITIYSFSTGKTRTINIPKQPPEEEEAHGGGDYGLARGFVGAVDAVVNRGWDTQRAQRGFVGCTLEDVVKSHGVVFAAEESRREEGVVRWEGWWNEKLKTVGV